MTPWTVAHQASLSMEFSKQEYWSGLPFPSPGDLSDPGSPALQADSLWGLLFCVMSWRIFSCKLSDLISQRKDLYHPHFIDVQTDLRRPIILCQAEARVHGL